MVLETIRMAEEMIDHNRQCGTIRAASPRVVFVGAVLAATTGGRRLGIMG